MDAKETANALELRAVVTRLAKARGKWKETDVPGRRILAFEEGELQIAYREPWQKHKIEHQAVDIFARGEKVFAARWKEGDPDIEIGSYKRGTWEELIKKLAAVMRLRAVE